MAFYTAEQKGADLSPEEIDENFKNLLGRIEVLEGIPLVGETLSALTLEGDEIVAKGSLGTELGRMSVPVVKISLKGEWRSGIPYCRNDWVTAEGRIYGCMLSHISKNFDVDKEKWMLCLGGDHERD